MLFRSGWIVLASGCKSLDEYRQLEMASRSLEAEKAHLEQELYDARNNNDNLRSSMAASEDKLQSKEMLIANLEAENNRLDTAVASAQSLLEKIAKQNVPHDPIVIETKLPAELDSALRDFANQHSDSVVYDAKRGIVKWTSDLLFALGSDVVKESAINSLQGFAKIVNSSAAAGFDVLIVGHTDDRPIKRAETKQRHPTNWHLSVHRAISVSNALQRQGVASTRIGVLGFGEYRPIASNATEEGRRQNRRVEIYLVPEGSIGGVIVPQAATTATQERVTPTAMPDDDGVK